MKTIQIFSMLCLFVAGISFSSCSSDDDTVSGGDDSENTPESCYVHLFDGDNFKDDNIVIEGEGEYSDLSNLSGANGKDWTDEADSFKVGEGTTMTVWRETNFQGDSTVYETGAYASEDEPYSLKIKCHADTDSNNK